MPLVPLYNDRDVEPAYQLRYGWTGWPSPGHFFPDRVSEAVTELAAAWEEDGLRLLEQNCSSDMAQLVLSTKPHVAPALLAARVKGRLQHALRVTGYNCPHSSD
jgi:hypothetical protein